LEAYGKTLKMGQRAQYIYIRPGPGVHAWGLASLPDPRSIDFFRYRELMLRAVHEVLEPIGVTEKALRDWLLNKAGYVAIPELPNSVEATSSALPLFKDLKYLNVNGL
jgi:hypothetical protein